MGKATWELPPTKYTFLESFFRGNIHLADYVPPSSTA